MEKHGGEIFVESEYGVGSKFVVRLPLDNKSTPVEVENVKNEFLINSMKSVEYEMYIADDENLILQTLILKVKLKNQLFYWLRITRSFVNT